MQAIRKNRELLVYRTNGKLLFKIERGGAGAWPENGLVTKLNFGPGAGYKGGRTLFFAFNSGSRRWSDTYRSGVRCDGRAFNWFTRLTNIEIGFTRNANIVPYLSH